MGKIESSVVNRKGEQLWKKIKASKIVVCSGPGQNMETEIEKKDFCTDFWYAYLSNLSFLLQAVYHIVPYTSNVQTCGNSESTLCPIYQKKRSF